MSNIPYKSAQQRSWAHTKAGRKALGKKKVEEFDKKSKGKKLPEKAGENLAKVVTKAYFKTRKGKK